MKRASIVKLEQTKTKLLEYFDSALSIRAITPAMASEFRQWLAGQKTISEATVKIKVKDENGLEHTEYTVDETRKGPVNALDKTLRKALEKYYSELKDVKLFDYKVRVLTAGKGTSAKVRVFVESGDKENTWGTVGVSENIIEASYQALVDVFHKEAVLKERFDVKIPDDQRVGDVNDGWRVALTTRYHAPRQGRSAAPGVRLDLRKPVGGRSRGGRRRQPRLPRRASAHRPGWGARLRSVSPNRIAPEGRAIRREGISGTAVWV